MLKIGWYNIDKYIESIVEEENNRYKFKQMNVVCNKYYTLKWKNETKGFCCQNEQIVIVSLASVPLTLYNFLTTNDSNTNKAFIHQIRTYNSVLAFTFLGVNYDKEFANATAGNYTFQIQNVLYHHIGRLKPIDENISLVFA